MYLKSMLVTSLLAASCLFADSGASVMINPETATEELSANGQSLIYRDIHVNVNDLKQNSIWKTSENANNELNTDAKTRIYYTKGGTIVGEECKDSTMINGCSGMRPFVIYEDVVTKASETGEPVVLTFQTPVGSTGNEVLQYFQSIDSSAKASTFWPMASNRIVDHNGNPMQIMRTSGTLISDYIKGVFNMPNLSNKDQRLISVKHKENIHFGLTKYKSETIKEDIEKGNAKLKNIYFMPDFWKNPESEGVHTLLSQPVKGNRPDALGILNYGAGCHRDLFGPIGFFVSDNLDSESEACKALRADNDFKDMETEIEMDTLIALVSAVDEHLISRDRKTFCDWMFGRTPEGEKYIDPVTGRTIYLDISASYDFSSEEDNVIMEVPVTDGSKIVDTSYLRINKIETGKTTNRSSGESKIIIKWPRRMLHDVYIKDSGRATTTKSKAKVFDTVEACNNFMHSTQIISHIGNMKMYKYKLFGGIASTPMKKFLFKKNDKLTISNTSSLSRFDPMYADFKCEQPLPEVQKIQITVDVLQESETNQVYKMVNMGSIKNVK